MNKEDVLLESHLENLPLLSKGKVRDIYDLGNALLFVATDRISAFDVILPEGIPGKGTILTAMSCHWFAYLSQFEGMPLTHLLTAEFDDFPQSCRPYRDQLAGRSLLVKKAKPFPVECIVRGYLSGSGWQDYLRTGTISGIALPKGLGESDQLPEPIFTPSTKAAIGGHDINISFEEMQSQIGSALAEDIRRISLFIYREASRFAEARGIIIADTKMEFGRDEKTGELLLIDELLTPDSSRFWPAASYRPGRAQASFDKQFVRDYLLSIPWKGASPPPHLPETIIQQTRARYLEALKRLTSPS